jgi:DNA-binding response OmpR family regulator
MMRLRQKLEVDPDAPQYFQTESGVGYRLLD